MLQQKFLQLESELNTYVFERRAFIRGLITALLAHEQNAPVPLVAVGPGGTAKTMPIKSLCKAILGRYFSWLYSPFTTPEDIFGAVRTTKMIEKDEVERNTSGKMPGADVIYGDEIFNANESILVAHNDILAEGEFSNGTGKQKVDAKLMVFSANRIPDTLGEQPVLAATWDRFVLRYIVDYLVEEKNVRGMLKGVMQRRRAQQGSDLPLTVKIDLAELEQAKAGVRMVDVDPVEDAVIGLWAATKSNSIALSDRRLGQLLSIIQVQAWLDGRTVAQTSDLAILANCLWDRPERAKEIQKLVLTFLNPWYNDLQEYDDEAEELMTKFKGLAKDGNYLNAASEINGKLKGTIRNVKQVLEKATDGASDQVKRKVAVLVKETSPKELVKLIAELRATGEVTAEVLDCLERAVTYNNQVVQAVMAAG